MWARRNIGRPLCDESVLIITLVRGTSRDAFADTYDKLSVYQQISFPNPAIFPLVCPRPSAREQRYARASDRGIPFPLPAYVCTYTRVYTRPTPVVRDCRVHKSAMTAKGRTLLSNKLDTGNRNVGIDCLVAR